MRVGCCYDRVAFYFLPPWVDPPIPQSCEREHLAIANLEAEWLFSFSIPRPLIKSVSRDQTALYSERIAEGWCSRDCLRSRVDRLRPDARIGRPRRNQPPSHKCRLAEVRSLADDWHGLSKSDVVARNPIVIEWSRASKWSAMIYLRRQSR